MEFTVAAVFVAVDAVADLNAPVFAVAVKTVFILSLTKAANKNNEATAVNNFPMKINIP